MAVSSKNQDPLNKGKCGLESRYCPKEDKEYWSKTYPLITKYPKGEK